VIALLTILGAALGAPSRWLLDRYVQARHDSVFPWGTFAINVSGSLLLGGLLAAAAAGSATPETLALAGAGFCGGFTTFSTFGYETVRLAQEGSQRTAALNVGASLAVGLAASLTGWWSVSALLG
jgi:fluoride exporter